MWLLLLNASFTVTAQQGDTITHAMIHMIHSMFLPAAPRLQHFSDNPARTCFVLPSNFNLCTQLWQGLHAVWTDREEG